MQFLELEPDVDASKRQVPPKPLAGQIRTDVSPGRPDIPQDVLRSVRYGIRSYINSAGEGAFQKIDISISVDEYDPGSQLLRYLLPFIAGAARVTVTVSGTVNGCPIDDTTSSAGYVGVFGGSSQSLLESSMQDCIWKLCLAVDNAGGREASAFGRTWEGIRTISWLVAGLVFIAYAALFVAIHLADAGRLAAKIGIALFMGLLAAAACMGVISFGALVVAPRNFLLDDPRGKRVMSRSGVKSPWALRILAALLLAVCAVAIACAVPILVVRR